MKIKRIISLAAAVIAALLLCAACAEAPSSKPSVVPQNTPEPAVSVEPEKTPQPTPESEKPISEESIRIESALEHLGLPAITLDSQMLWEELAEYIVKLTGAEEEALRERYQHPYTGVSENRDAYVGYVYARWIFTGLDTLSDTVDEKNMLSTLLRMLGYSDNRGETDFSAEDPYALAAQLQICTSPGEGKMRGEDAAALIWKTLNAHTKDGQSLADVLISEGVFSQEQFIEAGYLREEGSIPQPSENTEQSEPSDKKESSKNDAQTGGGSTGGGSTSGGSTGGGSTGGGSTGGGSTGGETGGETGGGTEGGTPGGENTTPDVPFG